MAARMHTVFGRDIDAEAAVLEPDADEVVFRHTCPVFSVVFASVFETCALFFFLLKQE